jgi:hypothetical protein
MDMSISNHAPGKSRERPLSGLVLTGFLLCLWLALLWLKVCLEPVHYQTVDGENYLQLANKIIAGKPLVIDGLKNQNGRVFSPFPPGYPALLCLGIQTGAFLPPQLVVHGFLFLIISILWWYKRLPLLPLACWFFTDTALELACYPWSEWSFTAVTILLLMVWHRWESAQQPAMMLVCLGLWLFLFSIRYAGVFFFLFLAIRVLTRPPAISIWITFFFPGLIFGLMTAIWFWVELQVFGQITGGDRYANQDSAAGLWHSLWTASLDQLLWFKDASGSSRISFFCGITAQAVMVFWFLVISKRKPTGESNRVYDAPSFSLLLMQAGLAYLLFMVPVRWYFYFAEWYDFRLLGPGFLMLLLGIFLLADRIFRPAVRWLLFIVFLMAAAFFTLPKASLIMYIQEKIWLQTKPVFGLIPSKSLHK